MTSGRGCATLADPVRPRRFVIQFGGRIVESILPEKLIRQLRLFATHHNVPFLQVEELVLSAYVEGIKRAVGDWRERTGDAGTDGPPAGTKKVRPKRR